MSKRDDDGVRSDWYGEFASKLIEDNFLLTALEFHAELVEAGREIPKLKDFFSNPGNFELQGFSRPDVHLRTCIYIPSSVYYK